MILTLGLICISLTQRYVFVPYQVTETKQLIEKCDRFPGKCSAATPLTKDGLRDVLGI